jgi:hypothetical protein
MDITRGAPANPVWTPVDAPTHSNNMPPGTWSERHFQFTAMQTPETSQPGSFSARRYRSEAPSTNISRWTSHVQDERTNQIDEGDASVDSEPEGEDATLRLLPMRRQKRKELWQFVFLVAKDEC